MREDRQSVPDRRRGALSNTIRASDFLVLSEIASKALSPGINDPGTALDILVRATRLLEAWAHRDRRRRDKPAYDRIHAPEIATGDLFDDAFDAIERDGAGLVEVALRRAGGAGDPGGEPRSRHGGGGAAPLAARAGAGARGLISR